MKETCEVAELPKDSNDSIFLFVIGFSLIKLQENQVRN